MQPHTPYLGESGERFDPRIPLGELPKEYDVTETELRRAYRENLDLAMAEVERLLEQLPGKTVVTADHGELLGERLRPVPVRDFGHPDGVYLEPLVTVPWFVSESETRKTIRSDPPDANRPREGEDSELQEHLRDLGYAT